MFIICTKIDEFGPWVVKLHWHSEFGSSIFFTLRCWILNQDRHVLFDSPNSVLLLFALLLVSFIFLFAASTLFKRCCGITPSKRKSKEFEGRLKLSKLSVGRGALTKEMENPSVWTVGNLAALSFSSLGPERLAGPELVNGVVAFYSVLVMPQIDGVTCKLRRRKACYE